MEKDALYLDINADAGVRGYFSNNIANSFSTIGNETLHELEDRDKSESRKNI